MKQNQENKNKLEEPDISYQGKQQVQIFHSFEEMNEADAREMAFIDPVIHLQNASSLAKKVFSEELKKPMDKTIKFK